MKTSLSTDRSACGVLIAAAVFFFLFHPSPVFSQSEVVPVQLARKAALHYAGEVFGPVAFCDVETYFDWDDRPAVYLFTLYDKAGVPPKAAAVREQVAAARDEWRRRHEGARLREGGEAVSSVRDRIGTKTYWKAVRHEADYVTVMAGATTDRPPVLQMYRGLPYHFIALEEARAIAMEAVAFGRIERVAYRYAGALRFDFEFSDGSEDHILVSPQDFLVRPVEDVRQAWRSRDREKRPDRQAKIREKWDFVNGLPE